MSSHRPARRGALPCWLRGSGRPDARVATTAKRASAVAYQGGQEVSRTSLTTATGPLTLTATADRDELPEVSSAHGLSAMVVLSAGAGTEKASANGPTAGKRT